MFSEHLSLKIKREHEIYFASKVIFINELEQENTDEHKEKIMQRKMQKFGKKRILPSKDA